MNTPGVNALLRLPEVSALTGRGKSALYKDIKRRVFTRPIPIGPGSVGWPASEVAAINRAKIAGQSEDAIRGLVEVLHALRADGGEGDCGQPLR